MCNKKNLLSQDRPPWFVNSLQLVLLQLLWIKRSKKELNFYSSILKYLTDSKRFIIFFWFEEKKQAIIQKNCKNSTNNNEIFLQYEVMLYFYYQKKNFCLIYWEERKKDEKLRKEDTNTHHMAKSRKNPILMNEMFQLYSSFYNIIAAAEAPLFNIKMMGGVKKPKGWSKFLSSVTQTRASKIK